MNLKGHLVLIYGSVQGFGFGSSSTPRAFRARGAGGLSDSREGAAQCHPPPLGLGASLPWLDLQAPRLPPGFLCEAPAAAGEEKEDRALG